MNIDGNEKFWNKGISACAVCDGALPIFRNKPVAVSIIYLYLFHYNIIYLFNIYIYILYKLVEEIQLVKKQCF